MSNLVVNYLLKFIGQAFKLKATYDILNQFSDQIIRLVILPLLIRKPSDEEL